jgi:hypothetical protein
MKFDAATAETARHKTSELFAEIQKICSALDIQGVNVGANEANCTITDDSVSLTVEVDILDSELSVSERDYPLHVLGEPGSVFQFHPKAKSKTCFVPAWSSNCDFGWREKGGTAKPFLSVAKLAEMCVSKFTALVQLNENGEIKREWRGNARPSRS